MDTRDLPPPPPFKKLIGPSFIILGLGLGSGEIILWPYLTSNFGLGLVWAIVIGITMQFFINMEVERYALIYGESIFVGFARWLRLLPFWFILSTFLGFGWPGIGLAGATLLGHAASVPSVKLTSVVLFLAIGLILSLGRQLYTTVETLQKYLILLGTPLIFLLTLYLSRGADWAALGAGLLGQGHGFFLLPSQISISIFLGALAFSGAGGNLNLAQSFYIRDKGYGMGRFAAKITSIFRSPQTASVPIRLSGVTFSPTSANLSRFRRWWRLTNLEHFLVFWVLGLLTMLMLALLAYTTTFGHPGNPSGINFVLTESAVIGQKTFTFITPLFLVVTGLMLAATQLTVLDSTSRIITENFLLARGTDIAPVSRIYYLVLWIQIAFGLAVILAGFTQPRQLITLSAVINAFSMFVYTALILYLNNRRLPSPLRPSTTRNVILAATFLFLGALCFLTLLNS
ncbi:hypothetical protein A3H89_00795 [Candidatus Amesbacteria bacterium RIFCSPLOWO2_02_FULL_48_11]|uniref:Amino acid permease n=1 Tax=Candidatus Amesbacteria bacterium GW2011_GWA2_47_11 TaxID=1618357 RepID=A0A0G1REA3_9BACT|nr:MAG: hypothetical protein UX78_C0018G0015 [Candidatus Amesbacteria bacterium GW2011_GWA2_47_11]OGC90116.1 MAG: hypothetical protein A2V48_02640 [Candidatus Amesbacteria bacterium RBG_19FT_COMBO_48_16]OGC95725.1 MAG: hypothetical protein A3C34_01140 [Candidatus Amesbacteria bacterium RIFCSPHIGHO2_02_FULL_48_21]OGC99157.1 MAG: hypothetical protein A2W16_03615 [Candidatus Amesbacteria bacterium RBG_16_48_31]OGD00411.1 MAG: hypothetical protein A2702_02300 [Candidatus Amesbacteria bacterium RIFC